VLLVGCPAFCYALSEPLRDIRARIVGTAHSLNQAVDVAATVFPDVALVELEMVNVAGRLAEWTSVIILSAHQDAMSPDRDCHSGAAGDDLLPLIMRLGGAEPQSRTALASG
jgi:hypothetical protein